MNNIYELPCVRETYDWAVTEKVPIDLNEWIYFTVELRCGVWFVKGHKINGEDKWITQDLAIHGVINDTEVARFIAHANLYPASIGKYQSCKVSEFNNLHYSGNFYPKLVSLLKKVEEQTELIKCNADEVNDDWFY